MDLYYGNKTWIEKMDLTYQLESWTEHFFEMKTWFEI